MWMVQLSGITVELRVTTQTAYAPFMLLHNPISKQYGGLIN